MQQQKIDVWNVTHRGRWTFSQVSDPYLIWFGSEGVLKIWRKRMSYWMNQWIIDKGFFRTAPATPGLLNISYQDNIWVSRGRPPNFQYPKISHTCIEEKQSKAISIMLLYCNCLISLRKKTKMGWKKYEWTRRVTKLNKSPNIHHLFVGWLGYWTSMYTMDTLNSMITIKNRNTIPK